MPQSGKRGTRNESGIGKIGFKPDQVQTKLTEISNLEVMKREKVSVIDHL